ncbi:6-phospho-beta-glucosidase [Granulicatella balaenopterae]|uniref:6-phospho-beta-glucosidase n=1 Tax=Granulicatella balaenopterae TaxID=137733 RepID=A0A1H9NG18_9LACT|nr:6-phospho-beta-glucosidase [Granulicatella balaenopterae]SER34872.1 6-phospho-beta-glucosidase [Granulicatella balaenopterae]
MKKSVKLVTIGGGSSYTPELVQGMINRSDKINISEWWFVDIEEGREKLEIVMSLAERMIKKSGLPWKIRYTLDRREALEGADFVTSQFRVGQLDARVLDESIPLSRGILGQETNGAGGIFKAFRTIQAYKEIIDDMKELCPDAWLVNFTNPAGIVTEALINQLGWKKSIGVCNIPIGQQKAAAKALSLKDNEVYTRHVGLNHFHFHQIWDINGQDRTAEVIERMYGDLREEPTETVKNIVNIDYSAKFLRSLNLLPCDYHRYYFVAPEMLEDSKKEFAKGKIRGLVVKEVEKELFELYQQPELDTKPKKLEERGGAYYSDIACEIICCMINHDNRVMTVSTANLGSIPALGYHDIGEMSCLITSAGPVPLVTPQIPKFITGNLQLMKKMELLTVEAAMTGNYEIALQAFMINPLIPHGDETEELLQELLLAHEQYLPQFAGDIERIKKECPKRVQAVKEIKAWIAKEEEKIYG